MQCRKLTFYFEQHTRQRISVTYYLFKLIFIDFRNLIEVSQLCLCFKYPCMIVQYYIRALFIVIFIMNLAYDFFDNILHCHQSGSTSKLIHDNGNMYLIRLKITKQIINHLRLRHKISRADQ